MSQKSRIRDDERRVRAQLSLWDRSKFLLLLGALLFFAAWSDASSNPLLTLRDAVVSQINHRWWIPALLIAEALRQIHFLISEHWAAYYQVWKQIFAVSELASARFSDWTRYRLIRTAKSLFYVALLAIGLGVYYKEPPIQAITKAPVALWKMMPFIAQLAFALVFIVIQFVGMFWFLSKGGVETYLPDDIRTRFTDVWGQDHVLDKLRENLHFLEAPEEIENHGGYVPGGILLWGPPGTGKTLMAEAMAGETGKPFVFVDPGAFNAMFMGVGILKVKSLFKRLRKLSLRYGGVVVFFDEADSLGSRGSISSSTLPDVFQSTSCHGGNYLSEPAAALIANKVVVVGGGMNGMGGGSGTLQALLTELSGLKKPRGFFNRVLRRALGLRPKNPPKYRILVVMATNLPGALDEALLRPGRIDRMYRVGYPSKAGRIRTYEGYLEKVSHLLNDEEIEKLATITPYSTGATIKDTINEALITAIRDGRTTITFADVLRAKQSKELGPSENVEYIERERHAVAIHEACHGTMAYLVRKHMEVDLATIEKGSDYLGMVASIPPDDQFTRWKSEYKADILVALASLAGERLFFDGDNSSGVSGDLESATTIASFMEGHWGMGSTISSHASNRRNETGTPGGTRGGKNESGARELQRGLADRIEANLAALLKEAESILKKNRGKVLSLAHALEVHKTISGDDLVAVMEGGVGPLADGRPYLKVANIKRLEEYHKAVLVAHKAHQTPSTQLPNLKG